jgi:hypothetical protein
MRQIDYDSFSKEAIQKEHKEHMEKIIYQLIHGHPKPYQPSIYYPIVVEAWERFRNK